MQIGNLKFSDEYDKVLPAFYAALGEFEGVSKNKRNEHFKSWYTDLAEVNDEVKPVLSQHKLVLTQPVVTVPHDDGSVSVSVDTIFIHESGQYVYTTFQMKSEKNAPQPIGSTTTYARRYALLAITGIAPEDDDGNAGSGRDNAKPANQKQQQPTQNRQPQQQPQPKAQEQSPKADDINYDDPAATRDAILALGADKKNYQKFIKAAFGLPLPTEPASYVKVNADLLKKLIHEGGAKAAQVFNSQPEVWGERWRNHNVNPEFAASLLQEPKSDNRLDNASVKSELDQLAGSIAEGSGFASGDELVARIKTLCGQDVPDGSMLAFLKIYGTDTKVVKDLKTVAESGKFTDMDSFLASRGK